MIEVSDLQNILNIVEKHDIIHFEFEQDNSKVVIDKKEGNNTSLNSNKEYICNELNEKVTTVEEEKDKKECVQKTYINSELSGTIYLRKGEGLDTFVKLHDVVNENTIVALVEVMKLFNEVEAGMNGEIIDILVKDGDFIEYGQPIFEIKPM